MHFLFAVLWCGTVSLHVQFVLSTVIQLSDVHSSHIYLAVLFASRRVHLSKYTNTANNSGMRILRFPHVSSRSKNTANMAASFYAEFSGVTFTSFFLFARLTQMSSWALVLLTSERLISVWMPFKCKELCSRRRIVIVWTIISLSEDEHSGLPPLYSRSRSSPCCCLAPTRTYGSFSIL